MTTAADDRAVEQAFEASLAGRPVRGGAAGLAAFTSAVRGTATQPGRPSAALADLLSTGLLTDQSSPSIRTAPAAGTLPSRRTRSRTRRRFTVIVPALIAKFLSAGAVAQAATGAGVVVVVVAGAGTANVLPEDVQRSFSGLTGINETVVGPAEDVTAPKSTERLEGGESPDPGLVDAPAGGAEVELTEAQKAAAWAGRGPVDTSHEEFKIWLAEGAENGWVDGQAVREAVHARNADRKRAREAARQAAPEVDETETETGTGTGIEVEVEVDEVEVGSPEADDTDDRSGNDNGKGRGGRN